MFQTRAVELARDAEFRRSSLEALQCDRDRLQASVLASSEREARREASRSAERDADAAETTRLRRAVAQLERRLADVDKVGGRRPADTSGTTRVVVTKTLHAIFFFYV